MWIRVIALFVALVACKQYESDPSSLRSPNDQAKIAVNYLGDANCQKYLKGLDKNDTEIAEVIEKNKGFSSHLLDGKDGELITEEYRKSKASRNNLRFSGDRFFGDKRTEEGVLTIETIEENCRRLLLSVDANKTPTIEFTHGFVAKNQQQRFSDDFSGEQFGDLSCEGDFCKFSKINDGKRYFVYLEPSKDNSDIVLALDYCADGGDGCTKLDKVTLSKIGFSDDSRYQTNQQEVGDHGYVSTLYLGSKRAGFTGNSYESHKNLYFKVLLRTREPKVLELKADGKIDHDDGNLSNRSVEFKVADICQKLLANKCKEDQSNFGQLLLDHKTELVFSFWNDIPVVFDRRSKKHNDEVVPLTAEVINNWLRRKGYISLTGQDSDGSWKYEIDFINHNPNPLWLHSEQKFRNYRLTTPDCQDYGLSSLHRGIHHYTGINRRALINHFANCVYKDSSTSDLEFLKRVLPILTITTGAGTFSHHLTEQDIDNWWQEIGGIVATNTDQEHEQQQLRVNFQDR